MCQAIHPFICRITGSITFLFVFTGLSIAQVVYYPGKAWESKTPEALKMNPVMIDSAVALALRSENKVDHDLRIANLRAYSREPGYEMIGPMKKRGEPAGMIIRNGYIAAQWGDIDRVDMTFSVTKSYLSAVAGLAIDYGLIQQVEDRVAKYVWDGKFEGPHNEKVTWQHLLHQTSDWSGCLFEICDWTDRPPAEGTVDDWRNRPLVEPGTQYEYNDIRVNLLAYALLQVWRKPLPMVLKDLIMDPIGASSTWRWYGYDNSYVNVDGLMMQSVSGGGHFGGGLFINTADQARFGLLYLRNGKWKDKQLLSSSWVRESRKPSFVFPSYGYMWWTNAEDRFPGAPANVYFASGFGGNYIIIAPDQDVVIVARWCDNERIKELVAIVINACN